MKFDYYLFDEWSSVYNCCEETAETVDCLDISNCNLTDIPSQIHYLINLEELWINNNKITYFYLDSDILVALTKIYISNNGLKTFPEDINYFINLEELYIDNNELTTIPPEIGNLINLEELNISNNKLTTIPPEINKLINLKKLYISNNKLTTIPPEIGKLVNLEELYISNNELTTIPPEIAKLVNLEELDISHNKLTTIPSVIGNLSFRDNLKILDISNNNLSTIPLEIGKLINLEILYINNNNLTTIPSKIGNLINLEELYIHNNNLTTIPIEITNLRHLQIFNYSDNPIEYIQPQVLRIIKWNKTIQKVYNDKQNVHNHHIQRGIRNSINYITSIKPSITNIRETILSLNINDTTKSLLFEYIDDKSIHSILGITFEELLISVIDFILKSEHKDELLNILQTEMNDSLCKCFTGRVSRLINVLNGFDPKIVINISDNEQIGNILLLLKERYLDETEFKEAAFRELEERGYSQEIIKEWLDNL